MYDGSMAKKTITTYEHSCDLCGKIQDEVELASLWGPAPDPHPHHMYDQVDICVECRNRPVDDVLEFFRKKADEAKGVKPFVSGGARR